MKTFTFNKEKDGRWFVDLPDYPGSKEDLEMVLGADTMLDILSDGGRTITLEISASCEDLNEKMNLLDEKGFETLYGANKLTVPSLFAAGVGAWYVIDLAQSNLTEEPAEMYAFWLCPVMEYIYGEYPDYLDIWIKS